MVSVSRGSGGGKLSLELEGWLLLELVGGTLHMNWRRCLYLTYGWDRVRVEFRAKEGGVGVTVK